MAQPKATFEAVSKAIELKAEGRSASIAAIQAITGGSNTTITVHKRQYEAQRPTIQAAKTININPGAHWRTYRRGNRTRRQRIRRGGKQEAERD